jgi:osmoprotectant transport system permease protein
MRIALASVSLPLAGVRDVSLRSVGTWFAARTHWHGSNGIPTRVQEHIVLCAVSVAIAVLVAIPIGVVLGHSRRGGTLAQNVANVGRAIPSLAILILAVPFLGIGSRPAELALVVLAVPPLLTNTYVGMTGVDEDVRDAARGVGMSAWQTTTRVEVPLALPLILAGLRTAAFQVVATATLAAVVGTGGLGRFIVDGLAVQDLTTVMCGSLLVLALAVLTELVIAALQRTVVPLPLRTTHRTVIVQPAKETQHAIDVKPAA